MDLLIRIVVGSILGIAIGMWFSRSIRLVPRDLKRKYNFLLQGMYSIWFSIILTLLALAGVDLSWEIVTAMSFLSWVASAWLVGVVAQRGVEHPLRTGGTPPSV